MTAAAPKVICPYCETPARFTTSLEIYRNDYGMVWLCSNYPECDAYVGVHRGTQEPLGRLANRELRYWKKRAHAAFDPYWKPVIKRPLNKVREVRREAYAWLAEKLGIPALDCHIGMFDVETCKRVVEVCGG